MNTHRRGRNVLGIITVTPLQLLIAKNVIAYLDIKEYLLMNINAHDSVALRRKYSEMAAGSVTADFLILNGTGLQNLKKVQPVVKKWRRIGVRELLFASIDNVFIQYIMKAFGDLPFSTFDDGAVNILPSGSYHKKNALPLKQRIIYYVLRRDYDQDWIKTNVKWHYTIFDIDNNIVEKKRLKKIVIFDTTAPRIPSSLSPQEATVFIGFSKAKDYLNVVRAINPDYYLPHPMENACGVVKNVVTTELIAEEYINQLLQSYERVKVYACVSTVLLDLDSKRIDRYVIDITQGANPIQDEYNVIATALGCKVITMNDIYEEVHET